MMQDLAMHILDLGNNSISAGAKNIEINLIKNDQEDLVILELKDDGKGMSEETIRKAKDPFYSTKDRGKKIGLGIPFIKELSELCNGKFEITSEVGKGTILKATFQKSNWDLPPDGDLGGAISGLIAADPQINYRFCYKINKNELKFDSINIVKELGNVPLNSPEVLEWIKDYLNQEISEARK